jgi:hypothetical protein
MRILPPFRIPLYSASILRGTDFFIANFDSDEISFAQIRGFRDILEMDGHYSTFSILKRGSEESSKFVALMSDAKLDNSLSSLAELLFKWIVILRRSGFEIVRRQMEPRISHTECAPSIANSPTGRLKKFCAATESVGPFPRFDCSGLDSVAVIDQLNGQRAKFVTAGPVAQGRPCSIAAGRFALAPKFG